MNDKGAPPEAALAADRKWGCGGRSPPPEVVPCAHLCSGARTFVAWPLLHTNTPVYSKYPDEPPCLVRPA